jgi:hypothetical protein
MGPPHTTLPCVFIAAMLGAAGCLIPSFDHMSGGARDADVPPPPKVDAATNDDAGGRAPIGSADASGEASPDAPPSLFACGVDTKLRCKLGVEVCCGLTLDDECRTPESTNDCEGIAHCGDKADCKGAGEQCCYNKDARVASCKTSCSTGNGDELVVCDKQKPTCPGNASCFGNWFGVPYCF